MSDVSWDREKSRKLLRNWLSVFWFFRSWVTQFECAMCPELPTAGNEGFANHKWSQTCYHFDQNIIYGFSPTREWNILLSITSLSNHFLRFQSFYQWHQAGSEMTWVICITKKKQNKFGRMIFVEQTEIKMNILRIDNLYISNPLRSRNELKP